MSQENGLDLRIFDVYMKKEHGIDNNQQTSEPVKQPTPEELQKDGLGSLRFQNYPDG